ncbi:kinetochore component CENP-S-domain-containing protein [Globomyces pollinis-pini]|nr:kinetochore component CENP-S-domain-containing protein [Globomyces pollinis-pini]
MLFDQGVCKDQGIAFVELCMNAVMRNFFGFLKMESNSDQETIRKLKVALHSSINKMVEESDVTFTPEALNGLVELTFEQIKSFGSDLELFAKHGKRSKVSADDIKLLLRKNPHLYDQLMESMESDTA